MLAISFLIIAVALGASFFISKNYQSKATPAQKTTAGEKVHAPDITDIESNVLFGGDIYWGRRMDDWSQASPLKTAYPFSGLNGFHRNDYDAWIANLECPTVPGVHPTKQDEEVTLTFNCSPDYLPQLAKWFSIVSMANNHSDNQGASGFTATRKQLDKNHIQYFGHYDPDVTDEVCEVVSLPVHINYSDDTQSKGSIPIAMCGYHGVFKIPSSASVAVMQKYARYMPVIAYPHMGVEYKPHSDAIRTSLYRSMIDNGADAVLANHPHWVQNSEAYKGKLIVYSMGNLIFDQQFSSEVMRSALIKLDLTTKPSADKSQLEAWLKLGPQCASFADNCLAMAEQKGLKRLPFSFKYGMTAVDTSNRLSKPASRALTKAVADRLDWNETVKELKPPGIITY